jgi:hypothetical protein
MHPYPVFQRIGPPPELPPKDPKIRYVPLDLRVHQPVYDDDINNAWALTKALILAVRDEASARGARFAIFEVNGAWQHYDADWTMMMLHDPIALKTWDRRKPNAILGAFLWAQHIPSLDLFDAFEAAKVMSSERLFYRLDPHWTPLGHRVAAHAVAQVLLRQDLVPHEGAAAPGRKSVDGGR